MKLEEFWLKVPQIILERGEEIRGKGGILRITQEKDRIKALVEGTHHPYYEVEIQIDGEDLRNWFCSCPHEGEICKHVVAVIKEAFSPKELMTRKNKRKTKAEMVTEILEKLSPEELRELVRELVEKESAVRDFLLARFFHYTDFRTGNFEAKYNALFQNLLQTYSRKGFLDYYATMDFGEKILQVIASAKVLLEKGDTEQSFFIAKCMLKNWVKNLSKMNDSSGTTYFVLEGVFDLFVKLYRAGKREVFDFLLEEARNKIYQSWGIENDIIKVLIDLSDSPDKARELLNLLDTLPHRELHKTRLFLKFFPEDYDKLVREAISNREIAQFHLEKLMKEKSFDKALEYVDLVLSIPEIPRKEDFLEIKAQILENLDYKDEAFRIYHQLFEKTLSLEFLHRAKKIASEEKWQELKENAEKILTNYTLLKFLAEEKEYEKFLEKLKESLRHITYDLEIWEKTISLIMEFPVDKRYAAAEILLEAVPFLLRDRSSRKFYRKFLSASHPIFELIGRKRTEEFLRSLISSFPRKSSLKDEIEKQLKTLSRNNNGVVNS